MIGRRCTHSNVFSRPVLIARNLSFAPRKPDYLSQVKYCGGYSGEDPPLPIPNREVKLTSADGTAPPGGRVGSCRFSECPTDESQPGILRSCLSGTEKRQLRCLPSPCTPRGSRGGPLELSLSPAVLCHQAPLGDGGNDSPDALRAPPPAAPLRVAPPLGCR